MAKTILITGASSGFGQAAALLLAQAGHNVFGTSRSAKPDQGAVQMLPLDVTDEASITACLQQITDQGHTIDVLINNAGGGIAGAVEDCAEDEVQWQMDANFFGTVRMIRAVLPLMRAQGKGRIITIGSMAGHAALPYQGFYSASKHALEAVNEALRLELRGSAIDATIVCPGDFNTGFTDARLFARGAKSTAHAAQLKTTVDIYAQDELNGADPALVGQLLLQLVEAEKLRVRYFVGPPMQKAGMLLKRILPASWFEGMMAAIYKLPK